MQNSGENMNNQDVVKEDMISGLPEALILQILSLLPTEDAIATSVLSKQWQSLWKMMPKLKFDSFRHKIQLGNVCRSLLSQKALVLQSFKLKVRLNGCNDAVDTGILIGIALTRYIRELKLEVYSPKGSFIFPTSLYNCETLETLKLRTWATMDVPSTMYLKSLITLHLQDVNFKDDESVHKLLSGCPNLQNLKVDTISSLKTFTIAVPSLQRISIRNGYGGQICRYVINAPSLKYLKIVGFKSLDSCLFENVPELVEANIIVECPNHIINENIQMGPLTSVRRLSLALPPLKIKFPTGSIFYQLVYLELYTNNEALWNLLTLMLERSPKLQVLKLIDMFWRTDLVARDEWIRPKNVPECLLLHLETFMWEGYKWEQEDGIEVAKYILSNTNHLKTATFSSDSIGSEARLLVVKDLKSVLKDTNSCEIQFKWLNI